MDAILIVHLVATVVLATANVAALSTTVIARRSARPARILGLLRWHNLFAQKTLVPSAVVVLVTGAWLTYQRGVSVLAPWLLGTLVAFVASALMGILFLLPEERRAILEAERLVGAGTEEVSPALRRHTASPAIVACEWGAQALMLAMFWLMIARPS